jgi:iron complex outermembrane receptor protein
VDGDGWTSVAGYDRGVLRPRLFFDNERGTSIVTTAGVIAENREGGTMPDALAPDGEPFPESLRTRHLDAGGVVRWPASSRLAAVRGSVVRTGQDRVFGDVRERGTRLAWFGEASLTGTNGRHTWVAGAAFQQDRYDATELPQFDYVFSAPALFAQDEVRLASRFTLAASARADFHSEYGTLVSPRVSLLARPSGEWTVRASGGLGAFAPTPFNEETEETGLSRLLPLSGLRAERAWGASADASFHRGPWELSGTVFGSEVEHPTQIRTAGPATVELVNAPEPTRTYGTELIARYRIETFTAMLTHAFTRSDEIDVDTGERREVPLTPRHSASLNVIWEDERHGSVGVEVYYTGRQDLEDDPYLTSGRPYVLLGAMARRRFGKLLVFVNAENLLDVRQTQEEPVVLPARRPDGRWLVDAWAPLDGRVLNGGIRLIF